MTSSPNAQPLDFQSIILNLQRFWAEQGCLIWQPYYTQVGAGTMNPATSLRVLGPEPWKVAYVEPSVRPDDGRYGENPNRLQMHYQFQVILKPDPGNPQEIYLRSLEALGIDPRQHDIRFVEDNWESPALGAWGLGWEVWLDGQEITQFTYFQQAGGQILEPPAVEITYGLERIAIALQHVSSFRDIRWSPSRTDGDVNLQAEQEHSRYYFEVADVERLRQMYTLFEGEAEACLERGLVLPAHDYILKCSHTFNILDTRGAVGVTERQALFGRMRDFSRRTAEAYLAQREALGFPWGRAGEAEAPAVGLNFPTPHAPADFLLEVGVEELPAAELTSALDQLRGRVPALLTELRLDHGPITVAGTPRRLTVIVEALAPRQPDLETLVKGPPADRAFDAEGQPSKAAVGFARSKGLDVADLQVLEIDGGRYVGARVQQTGRGAGEVLAEALPGLLAGLRFEKTMRWNGTNVAFSRPLRWLLALLGPQVVPFSYAGVVSGDVTRGLRAHQPESFTVSDVASYRRALAAQGILLDPAERQAVIQAQVEALAAEVGGQVRLDPALLAEVTNLVEAPTALRGSFDPAHLSLPRQVLISVMKKHQRYFPVEDAQGELLPYFVAVRNGDGRGLALVQEGNEHVIRARFADAAFFVREDLKRPLADYLPRLATLTFQVKLGSMLDKTGRIVALADELGPQLDPSWDAAQAATVRRAAELAKADLATQMVVEMTSLQGLMGRYYARHSGEPEAVAEAIWEHYLPRHPGDDLPQTRAGLIVGVADRLDSLMGLFAAGLAPSGNKDPFAQRRTALGLVQLLMEAGLDFDLGAGLAQAAAHLPLPAAPEVQQAALDFIVERLRNLLEGGARFDVVEAVLSVQGSNPAQAQTAVQDLSAWIARPDWATILAAYARCVRITRGLTETQPVDPAVLVEPSERALWQALQAAEAAPRRPGSVADWLTSFLPLVGPITAFFESVLVMAEDPAVRAARLGLLQRIAALPQGVVDLSKLEGF